MKIRYYIGVAIRYTLMTREKNPVYATQLICQQSSNNPGQSIER